MGTGSGIQAEEAVKYADRVIAVDINSKSVNYCKKKYKEIDFRKSDLFSNIKEKFDLIIFNPPYLPIESKYEDVELDGGEKGYELIENFLKQAKKHLKKEGQILLLFSSFSKKEKIDTILNEENYQYKQIATQKLHFEELFVYKIR